ncbi:DUF4383 domain-containing protein [Sulfitobacter sp. D35]|uniref:DUF4383 domain-containing protein n=1 Tax=Sulfitobacter sp. D35 TaxID=3083252 RepID=UPI00296EC6E0|nr:DUF4383 domain-containing protein [Sulfitobacter sp. D35]MDW4497036.1 DUF4383 domain-containing protein [Sulfitobacter sp. D35]
MTRLQWIALGYAAVLFSAAALNYVPGLTDLEGRAFGIFALDLYDDALHVVSGLWALWAGIASHRAARFFLTWFGLAYLADGLLGLVTGVGYLDAGICRFGVQDYGLVFKILANAPHILLGGFALLAARLWR